MDSGAAGDQGRAGSAVYERFTRMVGMPPMEYLVAWRMAVAKDLSEVAERVGYASASTFSTAFSRYAGGPPRCHARAAEWPVRLTGRLLWACDDISVIAGRIGLAAVVDRAGNDADTADCHDLTLGQKGKFAHALQRVSRAAAREDRDARASAGAPVQRAACRRAWRVGTPGDDVDSRSCSPPRPQTGA